MIRTAAAAATAARVDARMAATAGIKVEAFHFDAVATSGLIGAIYSTADRRFTAIPAEGHGFDIVEREVGRIGHVGRPSEFKGEVFHLRRQRALAAAGLI